MTPRRLLLCLPLLAACDYAQPEPVQRDGPTATGSDTRVTLDRVRVRADLSAIRNAIKMYKGMNEGDDPTSLSQLTLGTLQYPDAYQLKDGQVSCPEFPNM